MEKDFQEFVEKVNEEVMRSRQIWKARDETNTLADFLLILQSQVGQLSESVLGKGSRDPTTESIHTAAMAYIIYLKLK